MRSHITPGVLALVLLTGVSGCQSIIQHRVFDSVRPNANDYRDMSDDPGTEWSFVGDEGRSDQVPEYEADDQWFKDKLMSPRARSIERNLGVE